MTVIQKKKNLKKIIDALSDDYLDEAIYFVQELSLKDKKRIEIIKDLLKSEKSLFERLAQ